MKYAVRQYELFEVFVKFIFADYIPEMTKSKYAKFFIRKIMKYG